MLMGVVSEKINLDEIDKNNIVVKEDTEDESDDNSPLGPEMVIIMIFQIMKTFRNFLQLCFLQ